MQNSSGDKGSHDDDDDDDDNDDGTLTQQTLLLQPYQYYKWHIVGRCTDYIEKGCLC
jgi:hypothetical protein